MKEYYLEFQATEVQVYTATVKANSPEEAIKLFEEDTSISDWWEGKGYELQDINNITCQGYWGKDNKLKRK